MIRESTHAGVGTQRVYALIRETLRAGIRRRTLAPGTVLLEAPLAKLFLSSRSPVKQALQQLENEGLLSRFDGRGYRVGRRKTPIRRVPLTRALLALPEGAHGALRVPSWKTVYDRIERELTHHSIFGQFRINELELARHYKVGRTVAHDVLTQIATTGIIAKRDRSHWFTVPLDHKRVNDLFDLRALLEPRLCRSAVANLPIADVEAMQSRLAKGSGRYPNVASAEMDELEHDLHYRALEYGHNVEFLEALRRTRCILISAKHIYGQQMAFPRRPEFFFDEHARILEALRRRDRVRAAHEMLAHIEASRPRVLERLRVFRAQLRMKPLSFISPG